METSLSPPRPHDVNDGGAVQKCSKEEELRSSGSVDGAPVDGSANWISVDDGGVDQKCDEEEDLNSGGGEEERVSRPQVGSGVVIIEVGGDHGPIEIWRWCDRGGQLLHNVGKP
jgi:hypothetical protein